MGYLKASTFTHIPKYSPENGDLKSIKWDGGYVGRGFRYNEKYSEPSIYILRRKSP
jgi:hypothetical protein